MAEVDARCQKVIQGVRKDFSSKMSKSKDKKSKPSKEMSSSLLLDRLNAVMDKVIIV